jgi:hypothetical protein
MKARDTRNARRAWIISRSLLVVCALAGLLAVGCATSDDVVMASAPRDLACPKSEVQVQLVGRDFVNPRHYLATGCGRQARYQCMSNRGQVFCSRDQSPPGP